jgi:hypothetical protein
MASTLKMLHLVCDAALFEVQFVVCWMVGWLLGLLG